MGGPIIIPLCKRGIEGDFKMRFKNSLMTSLSGTYFVEGITFHPTGYKPSSEKFFIPLETIFGGENFLPHVGKIKNIM